MNRTDTILLTLLGVFVALLCLIGGYALGSETVMNSCRDYGKYVSGGVPDRVFICQEQK